MQSHSPRPAILTLAALLLMLPVEALAQRHGGGHGGWRGGGGYGHGGYRGGYRGGYGYGRHGYRGGYGYRGYRGYRGYGGYYGYPVYSGYYGYPAYYGGYGYGGYYGFGDGWAAAFGAGIIGLILGTAIASHDHEHYVPARPYVQEGPPVETYRCADGTVIPADGQCPVALVPVEPSQLAPVEPAEEFPSP